jgi:hypothetical protein
MIIKPLGGGRADFSRFHGRISEEDFPEATRLLEEWRREKAAEALQSQVSSDGLLPGPFRPTLRDSSTPTPNVNSD